jgi:hypothetical protein
MPKSNIKLLWALKIASALGFLYPIWYFYEAQFITLGQIAIVEAIIFGSQLILEIPTGAIADIWGHRASMILGYCVNVIALIVFAFAHQYSAFVIYGILLGLGEALKSGAEDALEFETFKELGKEKQFAKIKSNFSLAFQITLAISMIIGGLIGSISYLATIWMTVLGVMACVVVLCFMHEPAASRQKADMKKYLDQWSAGYHEITKSKEIGLIAALYALVGGISWPVNLSVVAMWFGQLGYLSQEQGIVLGIIRIFNVLVLRTWIHKSEHYQNPNRVIVGFALLFLLGYVPVILFSKWWAILFVTFIMASTTARWVVIGNLVHTRVSSENRATAISTLSMMIGIANVGIMAISGFLMPFINGPKGFISVLGVCGFIGCVVIYEKYKKLPKGVEYASK